jgi:hypothetical protein
MRLLFVIALLATFALPAHAEAFEGERRQISERMAGIGR